MAAQDSSVTLARITPVERFARADAARRSLTAREKAAVIVRLLLAEGTPLQISTLPEHMQAALAEQMANMRMIDRDTLGSVVDEFVTALEQVGLASNQLELELTEAAAMHDPAAAVVMMDRLHDRGIRMAIDDFGTGYSSLSYLKRFNVHKLKIDQSFVRDLCTDADDKAIITAIINMARGLGIRTSAEGVQSAEQLALLRQQGCDEVQGSYFSPSLAAPEFEAYLRAHG